MVEGKLGREGGGQCEGGLGSTSTRALLRRKVRSEFHLASSFFLLRSEGEGGGSRSTRFPRMHMTITTITNAATATTRLLLRNRVRLQLEEGRLETPGGGGSSLGVVEQRFLYELHCFSAGVCEDRV